MKLARVFALVCSFTLSCGLGWQSAHADDFTFDGKQLQYNFTLKDTESHTIYQDEQEPDTCYRTVQEGTVTQCHTVYDNQCQTEIQSVCHDETHQVCVPATHQQCHDEYQQECHTETEQQCRPVSHEVCAPVQHCEEVPHQECHEENGHQVCQTVDQQECHDDQECHTETEQQCSPVSHQVCENVPHQVCEQVPGQDCHDVSQQVCQNEPEQVCHQVPRQDCEQVPNMVQQAYACTKTVSVPVGTALDYNVTGNIAVDFQAPAQGDPAPNESFTIGFGSEDADLVVKQDSKQYLIFAQKTESTKITAPQTKVTTAQVNVSLLSISDFLAPLSGGIQTISATSDDVLTFTIGKVLRPDLLAFALELSQPSSSGGDTTVYYNGPIPAADATLTPAADRTQVSINLTSLKLTAPILAGNYTVALTASVAADSLAGLLNPDAVPSTAQSQTKAEGKVALTLEVTPANIAAIVLPITQPIADLETDTNSLSFELAPVTFPQFLELSVSLTNNSSSEPALFTGVLAPSAYQFSDADDGNTSVSVDLSQLSPKLPFADGSYTYVVTVRLKREALPGQIDPTELPARLQISATTAGTLTTPETLDALLAPTKGPIDSVTIDSKANTLKFRIPRATHPVTLFYQLKLTRSVALFFTHTLFNSTIDSGNITVQDDAPDGKSLVSVDLSQIGLDEALKAAQSYDVQLTIGVDPDSVGAGIDPSQIPASAQAKVNVTVKAN